MLLLWFLLNVGQTVAAEALIREHLFKPVADLPRWHENASNYIDVTFRAI